MINLKFDAVWQWDNTYSFQELLDKSTRWATTMPSKHDSEVEFQLVPLLLLGGFDGQDENNWTVLARNSGGWHYAFDVSNPTNITRYQSVEVATMVVHETAKVVIMDAWSDITPKGKDASLSESMDALVLASVNCHKMAGEVIEKLGYSGDSLYGFDQLDVSLLGKKWEVSFSEDSSGRLYVDGDVENYHYGLIGAWEVGGFTVICIDYNCDEGDGFDYVLRNSDFDATCPRTSLNELYNRGRTMFPTKLLMPDVIDDPKRMNRV